MAWYRVRYDTGKIDILMTDMGSCTESELIRYILIGGPICCYFSKIMPWKCTLVG